MTQENQVKLLVLIGITPILSDYIEDLKYEAPKIVKQSLKKALNDSLAEFNKLNYKVFDGLVEDRIEIADQVNNISILFEEWVQETFKNQLA